VLERIVRDDRADDGSDDESEKKSTDHCDPPTG
jgi:hypothetical protein